MALAGGGGAAGGGATPSHTTLRCWLQPRLRHPPARADAAADVSPLKKATQRAAPPMLGSGILVAVLTSGSVHCAYVAPSVSTAGKFATSGPPGPANTRVRSGFSVYHWYTNCVPSGVASRRPPIHASLSPLTSRKPQMASCSAAERGITGRPPVVRHCSIVSSQVPCGGCR